MLRLLKSSFRNLRLGEARIGNLTKHSYTTERLTSSVLKTVLLKQSDTRYSVCSNFTTSVESTTLATEVHSEEPNIAEVTGGNAELEHKLRVLILEAEVWRQEGKAVPDNSSMKTDNWKELLKLPSKSGRRKYLEFLFKVEKKKENRLKKKEQKVLERKLNPRPQRADDDVTNYDLGYNNIFLRFYDTTINQLYNNRLIQAIQFGQKLVVDCGYHEIMTSRENANCAKQLMLLFAENRMNDEPFDLHYCNTVRDSSLMHGLQRFIGTMYEPSFPLYLHEQSYLDIFPKEKLVYLTPHCREVLTEFDHDSIYIIGAIVDKVNNEPLSLAKAKKEGLRMAKLPLDWHLEWGCGSGKSLTINQVTSILLDVKRTGDWKYAFRHVPRRKLAEHSLAVATKKFENKLSYTAGAHNKSTLWKPSSTMNLDELSFREKSNNSLIKEPKGVQTRLVDVKEIVNK